MLSNTRWRRVWEERLPGQRGVHGAPARTAGNQRRTYGPVDAQVERLAGSQERNKGDPAPGRHLPQAEGGALQPGLCHEPGEERAELAD